MSTTKIGLQIFKLPITIFISSAKPKNRQIYPVCETIFDHIPCRIQSLLSSITDLVMTFISAPVFRRAVSLFASLKRTLVQKQLIKYHCSTEPNSPLLLSLSALTQNSTTSSKDKAFMRFFSTDSAEAISPPTVKLTFRSKIFLEISVTLNNSLSRLTSLWFSFFFNGFLSTDRFSYIILFLFFLFFDSSYVTFSIFYPW